MGERITESDRLYKRTVRKVSAGHLQNSTELNISPRAGCALRLIQVRKFTMISITVKYGFPWRKNKTIVDRYIYENDLY